MTWTYTIRVVRSACVAASGWLLAACSGVSDLPTAPAVSAPQPAIVAVTTSAEGAHTMNVRALGRLLPLARAVSVEATIGAEGGRLMVPTLGFTMVVPKGAVDAPVRFKVTALPGNALAYEFEPHGLKFRVPVQMQQKLGHTTWLPGLTLNGGYFKSAKQIDAKTRNATIDELLPARVGGGNVTLDLWHFSGYLVSMA